MPMTGGEGGPPPPVGDATFGIVCRILEHWGWQRDPAGEDEEGTQDRKWIRFVPTTGQYVTTYILEVESNTLLPYLTIAEIGEAAGLNQAEFFRMIDEEMRPPEAVN